MRSCFFRLFIFLLLPLISCQSKGKKDNTGTEKVESSVLLSDAKGFRIVQNEGYRQLDVYSPWQNSQNLTFSYYLVDRNSEIPEELKNKTVIRTPIRRIICLSTTHIGFLDALEEIESIKGLSGAEYVSNSKLQEEVAAGRIRNVGYDQNLNYEQILSLKPDVVMAYGVGSEVSNYINKLKELGITVILNGEYLEETPLGKAEWIKFVGEFYNKSDKANEYFSHVRKQYLEIKTAVSNSNNKPKVLTGLPWKDSWWMAGGRSNLSHLINDAGGEFLWRDNTSREAFVVSIEDVFIRAEKADYWINCGSASSIQDILAVDERFSELPQVKSRSIYNNNARMEPGGGNDYWESGVVRPDIVLGDLARIFHPGVLPPKDFFYYRKIN